MTILGLYNAARLTTGLRFALAPNFFAAVGPPYASNSHRNNLLIAFAGRATDLTNTPRFYRSPAVLCCAFYLAALDLPGSDAASARCMPFPGAGAARFGSAGPVREYCSSKQRPASCLTYWFT